MKTCSQILLCCSLLVSGCGSEYEDVSNTSSYQSMSNSTFTLRQGMFISGVNLPPGYGKDIDVYYISPTNPTWAGRELISRDTLPSGTLLAVRKIRRSSGVLFRFSERVEAVVTVESYKASNNVPIVVDLDYLKATNYMIRVNGKHNKAMDNTGE